MMIHMELTTDNFTSDNFKLSFWLLVDFRYDFRSFVRSSEVRTITCCNTCNPSQRRHGIMQEDGGSKHKSRPRSPYSKETHVTPQILPRTSHLLIEHFSDHEILVISTIRNLSSLSACRFATLPFRQLVSMTVLLNNHQFSTYSGISLYIFYYRNT